MTVKPLMTARPTRPDLAAASEAVSEDHGRLPAGDPRPVYKDVRALQRGLTVMEALGQLGWTKLGKLAVHTGIDRTSLYRLVNTLVEAGYVVRRKEDGSVNLSRKLLHMTQNLRDSDLVAQIVVGHLTRLTQVIKWPSDFAVLSEGGLHIAASTHGMSPLSTHRAMIGNTRPLFRSALGKALTSALPSEELEELIASLAHMSGPDAADARAAGAIRRSAAEVREQGYAAAIGTIESNIGAIALPVCSGSRVLGAINIIFFASAMAPGEAADRYLGRLRETVAAIEAELAARAWPTRIEQI